MKRPIVQLAALLMICAFYACDVQEKPDEEDNPTTNETAQIEAVDQYDSAYLASIRGQIGRSSGDFINSNEAYGMLARYKNNRRRINPSYDPKKDIYGFTFGLNKIDSLVSKIKNINKVYKDSLIGVRIYFARKEVNGQVIPDVFLIPVGQNGKNVYSVDNDYNEKNDPEEELILNSSVPCPNRCD